MKQKLISILLAVSALSFAGCGGANGQRADMAAIQMLPELAVEDTLDGFSGEQDGPEESKEPEEAGAPETGVPEDGSEPGEAVPDETAPDGGGETSAGSGSAQWDSNTDTLDEDGTYNSAEDVSLYLHLYDHLPDNYITKSEARDLGWTGGSVERYAPGCAIGGDRFGNREGLLPAASGRNYYECDIDTVGESSRGAKRIIFSNDGLIFYTEDHYESFIQLYGEE